MIVDTSALIAIFKRGPGYEPMRDAIGLEGGNLPAPALLEYMMVTGTARFAEANFLMDAFREQGLVTQHFTAEHAAIAAEANLRFGKGNGRGGVLNLLDLMVYAVAKDYSEPLLCTGKDFATTDIELHAASRSF
jgi:ribonuclease VapC